MTANSIRRVYSITGRMYPSRLGSLERTCHQKELLKKKGRSSPTGEMSRG
jgi:hypothetical protein